MVSLSGNETESCFTSAMYNICTDNVKNVYRESLITNFNCKSKNQMQISHTSIILSWHTNQTGILGGEKGGK